MSNIVLIAPSSAIEQAGLELKKSLNDKEHFLIYQASLDHAVELARSLRTDEVDVLISRGSTLEVLENAGLEIPIVDISVSSEEIAQAIREAGNAVQKDRVTIAYVGFSKNYQKIKAYLDLFSTNSIKISHFDVTGTENMYQTLCQIQNLYDVVISGEAGCQIADELGIKSVLLGCSLESLANAYQTAESVQKAIFEEKSRTKTQQAIFDSIQEGIINIDSDYMITFCNDQAALWRAMKKLGMAD